MERKNNSQLAREESLKNKEKCNNLVLLSQNIRFVGIINNFGRTVAGQLRPGLMPLLNVEQAINEHFIEATRNQLRKTFDPVLGNTLYTLTANQKVITLTIPIMAGGFYYITLDSDLESVELIELVNLLIHKVNADSN